MVILFALVVRHVDGDQGGIGVADVVKAPVHHVDTAVVGVRVPSPAEEKTHIG